eukprot:gene19510-23196_t
MFKSGFLESLSKVSFYVPLIVYVPVILYLCWKALFELNMGILSFAGYLLLASIPLALGFYFLFQYLLPAGTNDAFFIGFIGGYLVYDMTHYALHHANFKSGFWKKLKQHHMLHHYSDSTKGYGVSSDIWDKILGSNFLKKKDQPQPFPFFICCFLTFWLDLNPISWC